MFFVHQHQIHFQLQLTFAQLFDSRNYGVSRYFSCSIGIKHENDVLNQPYSIANVSFEMLIFLRFCRVPGFCNLIRSYYLSNLCSLKLHGTQKHHGWDASLSLKQTHSPIGYFFWLLLFLPVFFQPMTLFCSISCLWLVYCLCLAFSLLCLVTSDSDA